eukprot:COSAG04_NODE_1501_length_6516_cov_12.717313_4_plen_173_part_00
MDSRGARWVAVGTAAAGASYLLFSLGDAIEQHLRQRKEQYEARQLFNKMDLDLDGTVTIDELRARPSHPPRPPRHHPAHRITLGLPRRARPAGALPAVGGWQHPARERRPGQAHAGRRRQRPQRLTDAVRPRTTQPPTIHPVAHHCRAGRSLSTASRASCAACTRSARCLAV